MCDRQEHPYVVLWLMICVNRFAPSAFEILTWRQRRNMYIVISIIIVS